MDKPDTTGIRKSIKQLERQADKLYAEAERLDGERQSLERQLDHWEQYRLLVREWRDYHGRKARLPETQYCSECGGPILSWQKAFTDTPWCRKARSRRLNGKA